MAWKTPRTWLAGELVSDAMMNLDVRDQLSSLKNDHIICCGRLTLTSGVPSTTFDVTAATTVYFTPYRGDRIALYDGAHWQVLSFEELSISLGSDAANTNYDVFAYSNGGAVAIERLAWTNASTRAMDLVTANGVLVKAGDATRRYIGTYRTTATTGQTEDSHARRFVWNYYNRLRRAVRVLDTTDSWTYGTASFRQVRASSANQVEIVVGLSEAHLSLRAAHQAQNSAGGISVATAIGEDSTSAAASGSLMQIAGAPAGVNVNVSAALDKYPVAGYHFYVWLERPSDATGTTTWWGDGGLSWLQSGLTGSVEG